MNLDLSEEQKLLHEAVDKFFRQESTPARVRAAEPSGFDAALWAGAVAMGLPPMRVGPEHDGGGLSLFDAVLVAEQAGRHLASIPLIEVIVAARLLALVAELPIEKAARETAAKWLARIAQGEALVSVALPAADGGPRPLIPGGAVADAVICLQGDALHLLAADAQHAAVAGHSLPAAVWQLNGAHVLLANGAGAVGIYQAAIEEWKLLTAATLYGISCAALEQAAAYACERQAFDRPIGSFQGLAHPLADAITEVDGGRLAIWQAVSAVANRQADAQTQIALAYWWMTQAAPKAAIRAMRAHGGYGMTMEYDAQLYFRRARALALLAGDPRTELSRAGDCLFGCASPTMLPAAGTVGIDFDFGATAAQAAREARAFFEANLSDELRDFAQRSLDGFHPEFLQQLAAAGLLYPDWPATFGGPGRGRFESVAIRGVMAEYGWMFPLIQVADIIAKTVMLFGSPELQGELLPRIARGEAFCAMGYTEPSSGSDVFAARTRAVRDGDDWVVDGQKMFTSQGHVADYVLVLARTNPAAAKHAGLTLFLVPTHQRGYQSREVRTISHERTNITFYEKVRVSDRYRVGAVDGGVKVMAAALAMEQGGNAYFAHSLQQLFKHARSWALNPAGKTQAPVMDIDVRQRLARLAAHVLVTDALTTRAIWAAETGCSRKSYGPMTKLFATEAWVACSADLMELTAPDSLLEADPDLARIELESRRGIPSTVWGGASEVLRGLIAEDALGLPKARG